MGEEKNQKIWDRAFKTLLLETPKLFLPLIKEVFGEEYYRDCKIIPVGEEFYSKDGLKLLSDVAFQIGSKIYHFECQFSNDKKMAFRMLEYDFFLGSSQAKGENNWEEFHFPKSCVVYITDNQKNPKGLEMKIYFPNEQEVIYKIPTIRVQDYSIEEIGKKQLELFFPFLILRYANKLKNKKSPSKEEIDKFYREIIKEINKAYQQSQLDELEGSILVEIIKQTEEYILEGYPNIKEGVSKMLSETLELKTVKAVREAVEEAVEEAELRTIKAVEEAEKKAKKKAELNLLIEMYQDGIELSYIQKLAKKKGISEETLKEELSCISKKEKKEEI